MFFLIYFVWKFTTFVGEGEDVVNFKKCSTFGGNAHYLFLIIYYNTTWCDVLIVQLYVSLNY